MHIVAGCVAIGQLLSCDRATAVLVMHAGWRDVYLLVSYCHVTALVGCSHLFVMVVECVGQWYYHTSSCLLW